MKIILNFISVLLLAILFPGCASTKNEIVTFENLYDGVEFDRKEIAIPTTESREKLMNKNYFDIGRIAVSYVIEECEGEDRNKNCKEITHEDKTSLRVLNEAASRGGDLVLFNKQNSREKSTGSREGKCIDGHTEMRSVSVPKYETECHYSSGGIEMCSQRSAGTSFVEQPVYICDDWERVSFATTIEISDGAVFRQDPHLRNMNGIFSVLEHGTRQMVENLFPNEKSVLRRFKDGRTPLDVAFEKDNGVAVVVLLSRIEKASNSLSGKILCEAASMGAVNSMRAIIKSGVNVNEKCSETEQTYKNRIPLTVAAQFAQINSIRLLIENGADINAKDDNAEDALYAAIAVSHDKAEQDKHMKVIIELVKNGANVNTANSEGVTVLMKASEYAQLGAVRILLKNGADSSRKSVWKQTALDHVKRRIDRVPNHIQSEIIRLLQLSSK